MVQEIVSRAALPVRDDIKVLGVDESWLPLSTTCTQGQCSSFCCMKFFSVVLVNEKEDFAQTVCCLKKFISCSTLADKIKSSFLLRHRVVMYRKKNLKVNENLL